MEYLYYTYLNHSMWIMLKMITVAVISKYLTIPMQYFNTAYILGSEE